MTLLIREMIRDDAPAMQRIDHQAFDGVSINQNIEKEFGVVAERGWTWHRSQAISADLERAGGGAFVAESAGAVVGYVTTHVDAEAGVGSIMHLAVEASVRGQGVGRALLERAIAHFRECGLSGARIDTLEQNEAGQHLFPKLGFREVARKIYYFMPLDR